MSELAALITVACSIFGVLIVILGFLVKATVKWTIVETRTENMHQLITSLTADLVKAVTKDNDLDLRLSLLEQRINLNAVSGQESSRGRGLGGH